MSVAEQPLAERLRLVVITDPDIARPRSVLEVVREAVAAGAPAIQLRDKRSSARQLADAAEHLLAITRPAGALLFVNDRLDVALAVGAEGAHLGPDDVPVAAARSVAPPHFLIGTSTDEPERARTLAADGADYIGCGTVYATSSKPDAGDVIGLERLDAVARAAPVPVLGIGGVDVARSREIAGTAASGVAVIGAVMGAADVRAAVRGLMAPWVDR